MSESSASTPLSLYVHVPFCASRCGYCDFNTYTATELGDDVRRDTFHEHLITEIRMAAAQLAADHRVDTIFFGGGTPTLIGPTALTSLLRAIDAEFDVASDAEVTTEANPDSVDLRSLTELREGGFTRISFGMQSSAAHVLATLERTHTPGSSSTAARAARAAGFEHINLDMIYGTPGETDDDLQATLDEVLDAGVDHVSAYSLIVEQGTALARRVQRGEVPMPDDDIAADRYELIDERLSANGLDWYEVSNWAMPGGECRHNIAYWRNDSWWGIGPGAHSHVLGHRWWNVKHPHTYAQRVVAGLSPMEGQEHVNDRQQDVERIMLGLRMKQGLTRDIVMVGDDVIESLVAEGLLDPRGLGSQVPRLTLTRKGRLLADRVIQTLVG